MALDVHHSAYWERRVERECFAAGSEWDADEGEQPEKVPSQAFASESLIVQQSTPF